MEKLVIFVHIPKTAGTTMRLVIQQNYSEKNIYHHHSQISSEVAQQVFSSQHNFQIIKGNLGFGFHELLPPLSPNDFTYITMLRDPIQRTISHYYYYQQESPISTPEYPLDWDEFCGRVANNLMTRFLSGLEFYYERVFGCYFNLHLAKVKEDKRLGGYYHYSPEQMLALAKRNLTEYFRFFGITEKFEASMLLLKKTLGWKKMYFTPMNKGEKKPLDFDLSPTTLAIINRYNELDIELYQYAQVLFEQRISEQGDDLDQELQKFQAKNQRYSLLVNSQQVQEMFNKR